MREITGVVPKTVDKSGVIIGNSSKGGDLIQAAIDNGGTLPDSFNTMPTHRTAPGRRLAPTPPPPAPQGDGKKDKPAEKKDVSLEPTRPGPPERQRRHNGFHAATDSATPPPPRSGAKP